MTPSKIQVVTGDANAGEDAHTTAGLEAGATERSPFSCLVVSRRIMDDSFENAGRDGRCECGRGRPHDSRSGGRRYRAIAIFMPGCEPKDHELLFSMAPYESKSPDSDAETGCGNRPVSNSC